MPRLRETLSKTLYEQTNEQLDNFAAYLKAKG